MGVRQDNSAIYKVCVAKTQYSFSDDQKKSGAPTGFRIAVRA
ncbi:MAG: formate--tetrahydrofolate ligase, partial [Clostridiales bacterium]|nr:formate--tetrahydrofolate ligase [Clostridiales bacterium]